MRTRLTRCARDERGAVGLLFGVLLGTGVLFGLVALTFDYGMVNVDHSQLQSSADAAAIKAAQICVTQNSCPTAGVARLTTISQANDSGSEHPSRVQILCGRSSGIQGQQLDGCEGFNDARITTCPPPTLDGTAWGGGYVDAYTTKQTDHAFAGSGNTQGHACAAVAWGRVGSYTADLPITFSYCEWEAATGGDPIAGTGNYAPGPPYPPYPTPQQVIYLNEPNDNATACPNWNGHDDPGGFGWLDDGGSGCTQTVSTDDWVHVNTGNNTPNPCKAVLDQIVGTVIDIPVFDCQSRTQSYPADLSDCVTGGNGNNHYYHIVGFAAFYLTGWHLSGTSRASIATGSAPCSGGDRCLSGFFVKAVAPGGTIDDGGTTPDFGLTAIQTIG